MRYDVTVRQTRSAATGGGAVQCLRTYVVEARNEEEAYRLAGRLGLWDGVVSIVAEHWLGTEPYSVDIGNPAFMTDAVRGPSCRLDSRTLLRQG